MSARQWPLALLALQLAGCGTLPPPDRLVPGQEIELVVSSSALPDLRSRDLTESRLHKSGRAFAECFVPQDDSVTGIMLPVCATYGLGAGVLDVRAPALPEPEFERAIADERSQRDFETRFRDVFTARAGRNLRLLPRHSGAHAVLDVQLLGVELGQYGEEQFSVIVFAGVRVDHAVRPAEKRGLTRRVFWIETSQRDLEGWLDSGGAELIRAIDWALASLAEVIVSAELSENAEP